MTLQEKCELSYYVSIAPINEEHGIWLVQHVETKRFFVKKTTRFYNISVLTYLKEHPVADMPRILGLYEEAGELTMIEEYLSGIRSATCLNNTDRIARYKSHHG